MIDSETTAAGNFPGAFSVQRCISTLEYCLCDADVFFAESMLLKVAFNNFSTSVEH